MKHTVQMVDRTAFPKGTFSLFRFTMSEWEDDAGRLSQSEETTF